MKASRRGCRAASPWFVDMVGDALYPNDEYRTGWEYGFVNCKHDYERQAKIASAIGTAFAAGMSTHGADGVDAKAAMDGIDVDELNSSLKAAGW